ncbi:hypothetical protein [Halobiforma nitratireducens]|uniref:Uncharacterized protein n=1 Tax=Halobiforma nitratireducens JCM 10879 TaxID=1227454 RepID=M0LXB5_9EURY|nr:hypothetical protein [Halobiforma nitratireducens]EMA38227.1 hypothetical protein C446_10270 [Halobiforma nitratireducens JCM 10879]
MAGANVAVLVGKYAAGATLGTIVVAYGLQEFLSATGHSWFRHAAYQGSAILFTFVGWVILLLTVINLYGELTDS